MRGQTLPPDTLAAAHRPRPVARDLARFVRRDAELALALGRDGLEVRFGGASSAPGLKEGLRLGDFAVSGMIDRIDMDPAMSPRGLV